MVNNKSGQTIKTREDELREENINHKLSEYKFQEQLDNAEEIVESISEDIENNFNYINSFPELAAKIYPPSSLLDKFIKMSIEIKKLREQRDSAVRSLERIATNERKEYKLDCEELSEIARETLSGIEM